MNHTEKGLPANNGNATMDLTTGTATVAVAADRYGAHHRCKESPSFLRKQESRGNGHHTRKTDKKMEASVEARHSCESRNPEEMVITYEKQIKNGSVSGSPSFLRKQESKGNSHPTGKANKKMEASVEDRID